MRRELKETAGEIGRQRRLLPRSFSSSLSSELNSRPFVFRPVRVCLVFWQRLHENCVLVPSWAESRTAYCICGFCSFPVHVYLSVVFVVCFSTVVFRRLSIA